jgi:radical SAM protein with 4Fe4S-binding SPASM domain
VRVVSGDWAAREFEMGNRSEGDRAKAPEANVPIQVCIDTTYACNLNCVHCNVACMRRDDRPELSTEEFADLFVQLQRAGTRHVTLTGGEFLLRPDWQQIAREAVKRFKFAVFTNAVSVTPSIARSLTDMLPSCVEVSIYGATAQTYESVTRVPGSYDRFKQGLRCLREAGLSVVPKVVLLRENVHEWPLVKAEYGEWKGFRSTFEISPCFDRDPGPSAHRASSEQIVAFLREAGVSRKPRAKAKKAASMIRCDPARKGCVISAHGDVFPCGMLPLSGGNLRDAPFSDIWRCKLFEELRCLTVGDLEGCPTCDALPYCRPCWGTNYLERGDVHLPSSESCRLARLRQSVAEPSRA